MIDIAETQQITCSSETKTSSATNVRKASLRDGDVYINGRFLSQRGSGVQRFARQLVLALDAELACNEGTTRSGRRWFLLVPPGIGQLPALKHIEIRIVGTSKGHLWDQMIRFHCGHKDILINLANSGPIFRSRSISILHDAAVFRTPQNFTRAYRLFHQCLGRLIAVRSMIGTVSEFSRSELTAALGLTAENIFVVPNSCEHLRDVIPDLTVLERLNLKPGHYFLAIGSPVANKNLSAAITAFTRLAAPGQQFVVVGAVDTAVFGKGLAEAPPGVILAGAISDEQVNALLKNATALVFPSLYEGFGIPPLEAMLNHCPVIASDIPPVVEVCGDAVLYFNPFDINSITRALRRTIDEPELLPDLAKRGEARAAMFSWQRSALRLMEAVARMP